MDVGFTGTREGMTDAQRRTFWQLIQLAPMETFHHGDCLGADEEAHQIVSDLLPEVCIVAHPPTQEKLRANCEAHVILPRLPYLQRDQRIVRRSDALIACPRTMSEERRSGTWYTVRRADGRKIPVVIVWPDGTCEERVRPVLAG